MVPAARERRGGAPLRNVRAEEAHGGAPPRLQPARARLQAGPCAWCSYNDGSKCIKDCHIPRVQTSPEGPGFMVRVQMRHSSSMRLREPRPHAGLCQGRGPPRRRGLEPSGAGCRRSPSARSWCSGTPPSCASSSAAGSTSRTASCSRCTCEPAPPRAAGRAGPQPGQGEHAAPRAGTIFFSCLGRGPRVHEAGCAAHKHCLKPCCVRGPLAACASARPSAVCRLRPAAPARAGPRQRAAPLQRPLLQRVRLNLACRAARGLFCP